MKRDCLQRLRCPSCQSTGLDFRGGEFAGKDEETEGGDLRCQRCGQAYPILGYIPRFVPSENYTASFGFQWNTHRRTQLDSYTGIPISRSRLFQISGWPANMEGQLLLEAGSGAGRFTEVLLETGAAVFSFDYSTAVEANWANNRNSTNLHLFQADILNMPFCKGCFDKVICIGVIQHTPDPERAFKSLAGQVRVGGELLIDVYRKSLIPLIHWKYLLRPLTKRMDKKTLYKIVSFMVPILLPLTILLRRIAGRVGVRLMPIVEYSHLGLPYEINKQWSILDTFDMYAPAHDHPQSIATIERWYAEAGFENIVVRRGPNGVVAKGVRVCRSSMLD